MVEGRLAGADRRAHRRQAIGVRGRDGFEYLAFLPLRLGAQRRAGALLGAAQPRQEHDTACEHDYRGYGAVRGGGGRNSTRVVFETYIERLLAPSLSPGQVLVMDNLGAHRGERVRELIQERGCELLYLPPYSPDLNPIEEAFSKVKGLLRRTGARTREALIEAMGRALEAVSARRGRPRVLRAPRLQATGPTFMTYALTCRSSD